MTSPERSGEATTTINAKTANESENPVATREPAVLDDADEHVSADLEPIQKWLTVLAKANERKAHYDAIIEQAKDRIKEYLEQSEADQGVINGKTVVTYHTVRSTKFLTSQFRNKYPQLAEEFTETSETRRFVPKYEELT